MTKKRAFLAIGAIGHVMLVQTFLFGRALDLSALWFGIPLAVFHGGFAVFVVWSLAHGHRLITKERPLVWWWKLMAWWYVPGTFLVLIGLLYKERYMVVAVLGTLMAYAAAWMAHLVKSPSQKKPSRRPSAKSDRPFRFDSKWYWAAIVILLAAGMGLRIFFIYQGALDGDEGNYLYDAQHMLRGFIPEIDYPVRGVSYVAALAGWLKLVGAQSILAARWFAIPLFLGSAGALTWVLTRLGGREYGVVGLALMAINPFDAFLGTILKTEPFQAVLHTIVLSGFVLFIVKKKKWAWAPSLMILFLDVLARPSSLIYFGYLLVIGVVIISRNIFRMKYRPEPIPFLLSFGIVGGLIGIVSAASASDYISRLFLTFKYVSKLNFPRLAGKLNQSLGHLVELFGNVVLLELLALVVASLLVIGIIHHQNIVRQVYWGILSGWLIVGFGYFGFQQTFDSARFVPYAVALFILLTCVGFIIALIEREQVSLRFPQPLKGAVWASVGYMLVLFVFYLLFKRFEMSYVFEFLLPMYLLGAVFVVVLVRNIRLRMFVIPLVIGSYGLSAWVLAGPWGDQVLMQDRHFRRHSLQTVEEVTQHILAEVPADQEVFSGNTIFAANAGRRLAKDLAHPQYDYHDHPSHRKEEDLLNYLIDHNVQYAVYDYKMEYFYYIHNRKIQNYLEDEFVPIYRDEEHDISLLKKRTGL